MMRQFRFAPLFLLVLASVPAFADSAADRRIQKLEETVKVLEGRIATLEAQLNQPPATVNMPAGKEGWRKLQMGMNEDAVEKLLGNPTRVDVNQVFISWRCGTSGLVLFDAPSRKVTSWNEPR